jgi:hypothetical protein
VEDEEPCALWPTNQKRAKAAAKFNRNEQKEGPINGAWSHNRYANPTVGVGIIVGVQSASWRLVKRGKR